MSESLHRAAVVVAHPDDETLGCGGLIIRQPHWRWHVVTLCRASDKDRAPRFFRAAKRLGATAEMADLDDGSGQRPLPKAQVEERLWRLLSPHVLDLVLTHGPRGEYTRPRRHEECCRGVTMLWHARRLRLRQLWMFAYEDAGAQCATADVGELDLGQDLSYSKKPQWRCSGYAHPGKSGHAVVVDRPRFRLSPCGTGTEKSERLKPVPFVLPPGLRCTSCRIYLVV